jgi:hypothetical protein
MEKYNEKNPSNVFEKIHGIPWKIPGNSMEGIQWNSIHGKFHGNFHGKFHGNFHGKFNGIPWKIS